jgi:hypothetical protein
MGSAMSAAASTAKGEYRQGQSKGQQEDEGNPHGFHKRLLAKF